MSNLLQWSKFKAMVWNMAGDDEKHDHESDSDRDSGTQILVRPLPKVTTRTPPMYKVIVLNDDFTPRDFVVHVLKKMFRKSEAEATELMLRIHHQGSGVAGIYTYEIAETKAYQCNDYSKQHNYPLKCTVEKA